jgi:hypothetical protein
MQGRPDVEIFIPGAEEILKWEVSVIKLRNAFHTVYDVPGWSFTPDEY